MTEMSRDLVEILRRMRVSIACMKRDKANEIGERSKMLYTGKKSGRNGVSMILDESLIIMVIDVIRICERIIAVKLIL